MKNYFKILAFVFVATFVVFFIALLLVKVLKPIQLEDIKEATRAVVHEELEQFKNEFNICLDLAE